MMPGSIQSFEHNGPAVATESSFGGARLAVALGRRHSVSRTRPRLVLRWPWHGWFFAGPSMIDRWSPEHRTVSGCTNGGSIPGPCFQRSSGRPFSILSATPSPACVHARPIEGTVMRKAGAPLPAAAGVPRDAHISPLRAGIFLLI